MTLSPLPQLCDETLWAIINDEISDDVANRLVWHYLGYRYDEATESWNVSDVDADWVQTYPEPPSFTESRPATVKLTRSIPKPNKQLLKEQLGFKGYSVDELIPRRTRRATMVNWLLSYARIKGLDIS